MAITRFKFPRNKSIANIIRSRYGNETMKSVRKFEKVDFRYRKTQLDLEFLNKCINKRLIPKFLKFRVANKHLKTSDAYVNSQLLLLNEEIRIKESLLRTLKSSLKLYKNKLQEMIYENKLKEADIKHLKYLINIKLIKLIEKISGKCEEGLGNE